MSLVLPSLRLSPWLAALGLALATPALAADAGPVDVTLTPRLERDTLRAVRVELRFAGDPDGATDVTLPSEWGGQGALWRCLRGLSADGARIEAGADSSRVLLRHAPGAPIVLGYDVVQDQPGELRASESNPYRPVVQPGWFHLIGEATFARPGRDDSTPVRFRWGPLPPGWRAASDLDHAGPDRPLTLHHLYESVSVGGDFRVIVRRHAGGDLRVALRGQWSFTDDSLADRVDRIVQAHRRWWADPDEPFLVTLLPLKGDPGRTSLGGTGRGDAFAFFATDNAAEPTLNRLLAHEHLHTWIPRRLGRMPTVDEPSAYWFSEGFTDFYTGRLLVREGLWSVQDYVEAANEVLMKYAQSSVRTAANGRIVEAFWTDREVQDLPYQRGFLLAARWDHALRRASRGRIDLDDVLRDMKRRATAARDSVPDVVESFASCARAAGLDVASDLDAIVGRGEAVLWDADLFGAGLAVETAEVAEFTRGFDPAATTAAGGVVAGVDPAGPAWAAGLRDGMKLLERTSGKPGDSRVELVYRVQDGANERVIRYSPRGRRTFVAQQLKLDPGLNAAGLARLARRIGGD